MTSSLKIKNTKQENSPLNVPNHSKKYSISSQSKSISDSIE